MGEACLAREGADLHAEGGVEVGVGGGELLDRALQRGALGREEERRGVGAALVGPHVVHVVARGDGRLDEDAVVVALEVLRRARPGDLLGLHADGGQQRRERQQEDARQSVHSCEVILYKCLNFARI